jgi:ABC-type amino acid transport substrate-binding protein
MHTVTVALLASSAITGSLTWNRSHVVRYAAITVALTIAVIGGTRVLFASVLDQQYTKDKVLAGMHLLHETTPAMVERRELPAPLLAGGTSRLAAIRSRHSIRVGYLPDALPFAFFNQQDQLVGFDIEMAYRLAGELGARLDLVPVRREALDDALSAGYCDIVMSGVAVTTDRASRTLLSTTYLDETLAFVVPDAARERFATWADVKARSALTIAVPDVPYYVEKLRRLLPQATLRPVSDFTAVLKAHPPDVDALALPAERGSAWTLIYPAYSVVVPEPGLVKIPLAYPIARHDQEFATFINTWIDLKRKDGTVDALYQYWILGQTPGAREPRWSVIRNVLHWVE